MSTTMQLSDLRTATRQRADMVNSTFVSDTELNSYINQSYFELYDLLIQSYGDNYFVAPPLTFTTDGSSFQFALPDGSLYSSAPALYKLLGVDLLLSPGVPSSSVTVKQFDFGDRNKFSTPNNQSFYEITNLRYRMNGSNIWFTPLPSAGQQIQLWYVPRLTTLVSDSDLCDGISGWTEYIITDAAIKCMQKEESDVGVLAAQKATLIKRIQDASENRDAGSAPTVNDTMGQTPWYPNGDMSGSGMF